MRIRRKFSKRNFNKDFPSLADEAKNLEAFQFDIMPELMYEGDIRIDADNNTLSISLAGDLVNLLTWEKGQEAPSYWGDYAVGDTVIDCKKPSARTIAKLEQIIEEAIDNDEEIDCEGRVVCDHIKVGGSGMDTFIKANVTNGYLTIADIDLEPLSVDINDIPREDDFSRRRNKKAAFARRR